MATQNLSGHILHAVHQQPSLGTFALQIDILRRKWPGHDKKSVVLRGDMLID